MVVTASSLSAHQVYLSIARIDFLETEQALVVRVRIFTDDLNAAIRQRSGRSPGLDTPDEVAQSDSLIDDYVQAHFTLNADERPLALQFEQKKYHLNATECRWRVPGVSDVQKMVVHNDLLTEMIDIQTNVVRFNIKGVRKFVNLDKKITNDVVTF